MNEQIISAEIEIDAPAARVWEVLWDLEAYAQWNPFTPRVDSTLQIGEPIVLHVQMTPRKQLLQTETVCAVVPERELSWRMQMISPVLLAAKRRQLVTPLDAARTHYRTDDTFRGLLVPVVMAMYGRHVQRGFEAVATALKQRAEAVA